MKIVGTVQNWIVLCPGEFKDGVNHGRRSKDDRFKAWEDYWLKRGVSAASLTEWRLTNYSWDLELMLGDLCAGDAASPG